MARNITVTFGDGSSHVYENAPDSITPDQAIARAQNDFSGKTIVNVDGGRSAQTATTQPEKLPGTIGDVVNVGRSLKKSGADLLKGFASLGDTAANLVTGVAPMVAYPVARALGQSPQEATQTQAGIAHAVENPLGRAFGLTQDPAYQQEASRRLLAAAGEKIAPVAQNAITSISQTTGLPPSDVANMLATGSVALGPVAGKAVSAAAPVASRVATSGANAVGSGVNALNRVRTGLQNELAQIRPTPQPTAAAGFGAGTAGAAEAEQALQAQTTASNLPVPIQLMEPQATGSPQGHRFMSEVGKQEVGKPIIERREQQNAQLLQNIDAAIESTGANLASEYGRRQVGVEVDNAINARMASVKRDVNAKYEAAKQAGEGANPVAYQPVLDYINSQGATVKEKLAPILEAVEKRLAAEDPAGTGLININQMEDIYKFVGQNMGKDQTNILHGTRIKGLINSSLDQAGGNLYQEARAAYSEFAKEFKNNSIMQKLLGSKPGTTDRRVAFEDVFDSVVNGGSLDDLRNVARTLKRGGEQGQQAWREIQGQTLAELKNSITKNVSVDSTGQRNVSVAQFDRIINALDHDGKLDYLFGRQGAQTLRDLRDTAIRVHVSPPGTVNFSNTNSAMLNALDRFEKSLLGTATKEIPVVGNFVKEAVSSRIKKAHENELAKQVQEMVNYNALNRP